MNTKLSPRVTAAAAVAFAVATTLVACQAAPEAPPAGTALAAAPAVQSPVERGEYLVRIAGCHDCHTPFKMGPRGPEPDMSRMLSGHPAEMVMPATPGLQEPWMWIGAGTNTAFAGPWGVSYAANLTSDPTGIGNIDEDTFVRALRGGRHFDGSREILPPMPWPNVAQMTDEDIKAVYAYLRTTPAIANQVPPPQPPAGGPAPTPAS